MEWEASYQRYSWSDEVCKVFHFPFGWTNDPGKWARDWNYNRKSVIAQLIFKYNTPIKQTFAVLSDEKNYPVLYYCRGGGDRSMIMTGILYLALGVSEKQILGRHGKFGALYQHPRVREVFYNVNKRGGIAGYLKHIGVPAEHVENFKRNVLANK